MKRSASRVPMSSVRRSRSENPVPLDGSPLWPATDGVLSDTDLVPEVVVALTLLDLLERTRVPMGLGEIACALDISAPAAHALCEQMLSKAYLRQACDGKLSLGPSFVRLVLCRTANSSLRGFDSGSLGLTDL